MKHLFTILSMVGTICLAMLMQGCEADVDLNNIDTSVKFDANVATPIGSVKATIGDFVGDGTWGIFIDTVDGRGVITFKDTFSIKRKFHKVKLEQYISSTKLNMNVYEKLNSAGLLTDGKLTGANQKVEMTFPLTLKLNGINNDLSHQRLDSALINYANFTSTISSVGNSPIKWEWVDKITLKLGKNFERPAGNDVTVYTKGQDYAYGDAILISVDAFTLNMMINKNPQTFQEYYNNVENTCTFDVTFHVTVPASAGTLTVSPTSAFQYGLNVQFIDYEAIWGMFQPENDMSASALDDIGEAWPTWKTIPKLCLPIAKPKVDVQITTQIAGAMIFEGDYLFTENYQGERRYATFDGKHEFYKYFNPNEYLPLDSEIGDSTTMHVLFDNDAQRGKLDNLFSIRPDKVGYKFALKFNEQETPQLRVTNNTNINVAALCEIPFAFNEGIELAYADTIKGIDLSMVDYDSLLNEIEVLDTLKKENVKLVITIENTIPLQVEGVLTCLDENNNVIIDPRTKKPLTITNHDTIVIKAPQLEFENYVWKATASENIEVVEVDRYHLETLKQIKKIAFYAELNDKSLQEAYDQGLSNVQLTEDNYLKIHLGIGATVDAVLNFESLTNQ